MAMQIRRYGAEGIAQYGSSRANLLACGLRPSSGEYSPCIAMADAMVIDFGEKNWVVALWNRFLKLVFKRHKT